MFKLTNVPTVALYHSGKKVKRSMTSSKDLLATVFFLKNSSKSLQWKYYDPKQGAGECSYKHLLTLINYTIKTKET